MKLKLSFASLALCLPLICHAQPSMAYGHLVLPIGVNECLGIASHLFEHDGYRVGESGESFVFAVRDIHHAVIVCSEAPERMTWVSIVVASEARNADVPSRARDDLQRDFQDIVRRHDRDR